MRRGRGRVEKRSVELYEKKRRKGKDKRSPGDAREMRTGLGRLPLHALSTLGFSERWDPLDSSTMSWFRRSMACTAITGPPGARRTRGPGWARSPLPRFQRSVSAFVGTPCTAARAVGFFF